MIDEQAIKNIVCQKLANYLSVFWKIINTHFLFFLIVFMKFCSILSVMQKFSKNSNSN